MEQFLSKPGTYLTKEETAVLLDGKRVEQPLLADTAYGRQ